MNNLINAKNVNVDLENGFIYAYETDERENLFQACLNIRKDGNGYKKELSISDSGWSDGVCGDFNDGADESDFKDFVKLARKCGVRIVE